MRVLAVETSTLAGGIAIVDDNGLVSEIRLNVSVEHSERLMPAIEYLLKNSRLTIDDIDVFAISAGPGSFTGLRVGMATVKGLSFATGKPIVAVPTLEAMAWQFPFSAHPVCPVIDARRGQVFTALYRWKYGDFVALIGPSIVERKGFVEFIRDIVSSEKVILTGNGYIFYKDLEDFLIPPHDKLVPSASNIGIIGMRLAKMGRFSDPLTLTPLYLRRSQAEEKISHG